MTILRILLIVIFLIAALAVTVVVLLQEGKSAGLGSIGGSTTSGESYWDKNKKYSLEGKFERWTKIAAAVMIISAFVLMFIPNSTASSTENNSTTEITQPAESAGTETSADENQTDAAVENQDASSTEATSGETESAAGTSETTESPAVSETPAQ